MFKLVSKSKQKITTSPLGRVVIFLLLFVVISGVIGAKIVGGGIVNRDGFAVYGGLGKAAIFGVLALLLLIRKKGFTTTLVAWRPTQAAWLLASAWFCLVALMSVSSLIAGDRTDQNILLAHIGLTMSVVCALLGSYGLQNLRVLCKTYKRELFLAVLIAAAFYGFLLGVYALWEPLASIVMTAVHGLLLLIGLPVDVVPPNVLVTDKFGITVAQYCSGIESIALFSGLYAIVGLLDYDRLNVRRYVAIFPVALLALFGLNILRVFGLVAAGYYINAEIAFSLFHSYAGMVFFILYSVLFWSIAYKYLMKKPSKTEQDDGKKEPQQVIISHVYSSQNKGDAALTSVLIDDIHRVFPKANATILRLEPITQGSTFEGVPEQESFMCLALNRYKHPLAKLAYTFYMVNATLLWALWYRLTQQHLYLPPHLRTLALTYQASDLIVAVGGGYIRSRKGLVNRLNVPLLLHPLVFGKILGKTTIIYSQSIGPFQNRFEAWQAAHVLRRMDKILLREDTSQKLLEKLGVTKNVIRTIDSGFLLQSGDAVNLRKQYHIPRKKLLIGVTVRAWLTGEAQTRYEQAVAKALDTIAADYDAHIIFIPQVTAAKGDDDRATSRKVFEAMEQSKRATVVEDMPDHHQIKAMYDQLDVLLGTRFHSVIFSLTSYVPVLAIEYEHKTSGIMHDLELDAWVVKIEITTAPILVALLEKLIRERSEYRVLLQKRLPPYQKKALQAATIMAKVYRDAKTTR